ncbi:hypothetical protein [uncultured Bradyrhizobium sp.]|uniref:hypothetical protein n=1 Tax=uncultured Bradyrhizobium sp. TaxID=199684 RepID=UPI0035CBEA49
MKILPTAVTTALAVSAALAYAQASNGTAGGLSKHREMDSRPSGALVAQAGAPSGRGSTTGDPAASSANPASAPITGTSTTANPSGSGTSTSGGKDDNGDQGRDKLPEGSHAAKPHNKM